jgi:hypothetical protein
MAEKQWLEKYHRSECFTRSEAAYNFLQAEKIVGIE